MRLVTWNINSVRLRLDIVDRLIDEESPDILCLQEIKVDEPLFPYEHFAARGYSHAAVAGQKGYHGVATLARVPIETPNRHDWCGRGDARHICVGLENGVMLHNFYVPAGGDIPDPAANEKFAHKLDFLDEMTRWFSARQPSEKMILVGDLNVAPSEYDVWSHKQLLKVVSHTPVEVEKLRGLQQSLDWRDVVRHFSPEPEKLYSWWSYRARDWRTSNRGRRLDHVWVTPPLAGVANDMRILKDARDWGKPSDHAPVIVDFDF